jgi:multisubunit Na+/H+ antiporter MnhG subunit
MTPAVLPEPPGTAPQPQADYSLRRYLAEAFEVVTNADSRLLRTFRALLARPGALTAAYFSPERDEYLRPQQVLLFGSVFFFFMQPLIGFNGLNSPLSIHLSETPYSPLVAPMIAAEVARRGGDLEAYRAVFDAAVDAHARTLAFLLVPIFALLVTLVFWRPRRFFVRHLVFATHFIAFLLFLLAPMALVLSYLARAAYSAGYGEGVADAIGDSFGPGLICAVYLGLALRTAYGEGRAWAVTKAAILSVGMIVVLTVYRFTLFLATFYGL